ncbi:MAG TPA: flagellar basal body P-ring protein FlgI [Tepidisphaeraceae bacterium]|nr:flagellar basal body P-ring protein FlgI [Tepidisphaeraceae bacterium]
MTFLQHSPSPTRTFSPTTRTAAHLRLLLCALLLAPLLTACSQPPKKKPVATYTNLGPRKNLPPYLKGSVYELVELENDQPFYVSAYGLVGQLRGTGDTDAPAAVRQWMVREMVRRGFGSPGMGFEHLPPGRVLASPDFAIVRVDAAIPPGVRRGDRVDAWVSALANDTTSLAHGVLYETELRANGANPQAPSVAVDVVARTGGPLLVNPAYALGAPPDSVQAKSSLRRGMVFNGVVHNDRPLFLILRQPQHSVARAVERRINERFQREADRNAKNNVIGKIVAEAQDEGVIHAYLPRAFRGDWEHFAGVVSHLYLNNSPGFVAAKAKELADQAVKPGAPLLNISYCWEGLGGGAMPHVAKLMSHPDPAVAFAAARAAACIGDTSMAAQETLARMATTRGHPFQLSAIEVLGKLPPSTALNQVLRRLLEAREATVRIEAYRVLAAHGDTAVFSRPITRFERQKFLLDVVYGDGPPLVYASQRGLPRLSILGRTPMLRTPLTFSALDNRLTISTVQLGEAGKEALAIFYRDPRRKQPVKVMSRPDLAELAARLAGEGATGEDRLDFTYGEVVAILQSLSDGGHIVSTAGPDGRQLAASFVLQDPPRIEDQIRNAPSIDEGRPQGGNDVPERVGRLE